MHEQSGQKHWRVVKWIMRYLKGSLDMTLCYGGTDVRLHGYVDSDFAVNVESRKSTTGYVFTLELGIKTTKDSYFVYDRD